MWKWTDYKNIKAIILDCDTLDEQFIHYDYSLVIPDVIVINACFSYNDKMLEENVIEYKDFNSLVKESLELADCESCSIISISRDIGFMKYMMQYHIGTIFAGSLNKETLKSTPDFTYKTKSKLEKILSNENYGYGAEVMATGKSDNERNKFNILIYRDRVQLSDGSIVEIDLYFGGRYYSRKHEYLIDDPLSIILKSFKNDYCREVDLFYDAMVIKINNKEPIDILTFPPLKPADLRSGRFKRFESLDLKNATLKDIKLQNILKCTKDFSQKTNDYNTRQSNVKGAYQINDDALSKIPGNHIVVIDDLYTSGATIREIAKVLYEHGARKVSAIMLAVNQTTESNAVPYKNLICSECKSSMSLKLGRNGLFFGCNNYESHRGINTSLNLLKGIEQLKRINSVNDIDVLDLDDEY